jgi:hypothetical protein
MTPKATALPTGISKAIPKAAGGTYLPFLKLDRIYEMDVYHQFVEECILFTEKK